MCLGPKLSFSGHRMLGKTCKTDRTKKTFVSIFFSNLTQTFLII